MKDKLEDNRGCSVTLGWAAATLIALLSLSTCGSPDLLDAVIARVGDVPLSYVVKP